MDKIKDIGFLVFKKHLFWTLGTIVLIMGVVAWWMASGTLAGEYDDNKKKVDTALQTISGVSNKPIHEIYNQESHDGLIAENNRRAKDVYLAWREKYIRQRRDVLVWPEGLSQAFVDDVENILNGRPIEEVTLDTKNDLITTRREEFRDQINVLLPQLAEIINSEWAPTEASRRGNGRGSSGSQFNRGSSPFRVSEGRPAPPGGDDVPDEPSAVT